MPSIQARLAFGIELHYNELRRLLYVGRRWYKGEHGMGLKESESVDVEPDPARGPYYDFTDEGALQYALENMLDRDLYTGPWLKYHLQDAIKDLLIRIGMPNEEPESFVEPRIRSGPRRRIPASTQTSRSTTPASKITPATISSLAFVSAPSSTLPASTLRASLA